VQTQFVFDLGIFERFMVDVRNLGIDHKCGVMARVGPVQSLRALEYISTKVPGIPVLEAMVRRLMAFGPAKDGSGRAG
jgi:methylenetetrahydrofolate reductase (NADPH)